MTVQRMEHIGVVVEDLDEAIDFFVELGLALEGRTSVEGEAVDRVTGLKKARSDIAILGAPDGGGTKLELARFQSPTSPADDGPAPSNAPGIRHILFAVDDIEDTVARLQARGAELVGEVVNYEDIYMLCYIRGPQGIIVELAEKLG